MRKIIHIDMDAFYAAIEQRDYPELKGKPVVVGGNPHSRGVVATASYEARKYGIHSAMSSMQAYRLCPHAIFVGTRFAVYKEVSEQLHRIFSEYTDLIEPLSLDEAFLDVTTNTFNEPSATRLAKKILEQIYAETNLTASAGVSFNKFLAKLGSGWCKPNGLTVITPGEAASFIEKLPIGRFYGVGKATEKKMLKLGIRTGKDLKDFGMEDLQVRFGKMGIFFYRLAHCQDERLVNPSRIRKSLGKEVTFDKDISEIGELKNSLFSLCKQVNADLIIKSLRGRTISVKVRFENFKTVTRSRTLPVPISALNEILETADSLLGLTEAGKSAVRLLGVSVSSFEAIKEEQLTLF